MKTIETRLSLIELLPHNIIRVKVKERALINKEGMLENLEAYRQLIGNRKAYFLTIFHSLNTADNNIVETFESKDRTNLKIAEAFVVASLANRIELEFYTKNTKQTYPTQLFVSEEEALAWLISLQETASH